MADTDAAKKLALREEISKLRRTLIQLEGRLNTVDFKTIESQLNVSNVLNESQAKLDEVEANVPTDVNAKFSADLFRFGGFDCFKSNEQQLVFYLSSGSKYQKSNVFMIIFTLIGGKPAIKKWVMPPSVNVQELIEKMPLNNFKELSAFLIECKHYVDVYAIRCEQYTSLKEAVDSKINCNLSSDTGLTYIVVEFLNLYDTETDVLMNIRVFLMYQTDEVRPFTMKIEDKTGDELSDETISRLKSILKPLTVENLQSGFETVYLSMSNDGPFVFKQTDAPESNAETDST